jgi:hypothetical protein
MRKMVPRKKSLAVKTTKSTIVEGVRGEYQFRFRRIQPRISSSQQFRPGGPGNV